MSLRGSLLGLALAVACTGCAGSVSGSGEYAGAGGAPITTAPGSSGPATTTPTEATTDPPPASTEETSTTQAPPTTEPPTPAGGLADQEWVVVSTSFTSTFDIFFGTAEVTNTAATPRSGIFTFTLSQAGAVVATLIGSADATPAGQTTTVDLFGGDTFVEGPYDVAFEVSFTY